MPPPPAEGFASRIFLGPALRAQPDGRLVSLVRQGYEAAFEEIVRRYHRALGRYAAAIVPRHRAEDVTQDAFSKALLALRHTEQEIELRPWLYRIVRNTALNDLRDQPRAEALDERLAGFSTAHDEFERREELSDLMSRLRALPEPQRAAIVMRELEGLSHEEIAASLGLSGGGARQTIYRARKALREGAGMLVPLPVLKALLTGGVVADAGAAGAGAGAGGAAFAGAGGGGGAAIGLKAAAATVLVAGTVGTGIAIEKRGAPDTSADAATVARAGRHHPGAAGAADNGSSASASADDGQGRHPADGSRGGSSGGGRGAGSGSGHDGERSGSSGPGGGGEVSSGEGSVSSGSGGGGRLAEPEHSGEGGHSGTGGGGSSGTGPGTGSHEGSGGSGSGGSGSGEESTTGGSGSGESGGSLSSGPGSGPELPELETSASGSSGSGSSGSLSGGSGTSGSDDPLAD